jgi:hypothetical protein
VSEMPVQAIDEAVPLHSAAQPIRKLLAIVFILIIYEVNFFNANNRRA